MLHCPLSSIVLPLESCRDKFHTGKHSDVPIHEANGTVDKNHNSDIRNAPRNYAALGPSKSNDSVFQGAAEESVAEGAISRPTSQASIRSNEVSSNPTLKMVAQAHPNMLDLPYDSCNWENTTVGCDGGGHNETSLNHQHAERLYNLSPDYKLPDQEATADDSHKTLQNDKGTTSSQGGTTHQPPPHAPPSVLPTAKGPMQTQLLRLQRRGGNQALVVPHMTAWPHLPALLCLQQPSHPNNTAAIPNHLPRPRAPVSLTRITSTAKWTSLARSLPPPQLHLLPTSHTLHHPPQPRGLSPHKRLAWIMFMQQLTIPSREKASKVECGMKVIRHAG